MAPSNWLIMTGK